MTRVTLLLTPLDVSLFRDSRPFDAESSLARTQMPSPATMAGAIRTWLLSAHGVKLAALGKKLGSGKDARAAVKELVSEQGKNCEWIADLSFAGPLMHSTEPGGSGTWYPIPLNAAVVNPGQWIIQAPLNSEELLPGYEAPPGAPDSFRPAIARTDLEPESPAGFVDEAEIYEFLNGAPGAFLPPGTTPVKWESELSIHELRNGHALDSAKATTVTGRLYTTDMLRNRKYFVFRVDVESNEVADLLATLQNSITKMPWLRLGGEGKAASIRCMPGRLPRLPGTQPTGKFTTVLATPALFEGGNWFPKRLAEKYKLCGAIVGAPYFYQGWDIARRRPRATEHGVAPGTVYFWDAGDDPIPEYHGKCISDSEEHCQSGWGLCLRGVWDYA